MADNTIYVLSLSYGKDSLSCLGAIEKLGLPLDRIVHAEVWATQDIPADLPPMVEFKAKADKIIKDRYGIEVEHVCAVNKNGGGCSLTKPCLVEQPAPQSTDSTSTASQSNKVLGVQASSNKTCLPKLTYEDIFYRERVNRRGGGMYKTLYKTYGFPMQKGNWCNNLLKINALNSIRIPVRKLDGRLVQGAQNERFQKARTRRAIQISCNILALLRTRQKG